MADGALLVGFAGTNLRSDFSKDHVGKDDISWGIFSRTGDKKHRCMKEYLGCSPNAFGV